MKVITICGSMKFKKEMIEIAYNLEAKQNYCVIQCVYGNDNDCPSPAELENLAKCHYKK